jgi:hypothetical protein
MSFFKVLAERHAMFASMFLSTLLWIVVDSSICFSGPVNQQFACANQQIRICRGSRLDLPVGGTVKSCVNWRRALML